MRRYMKKCIEEREIAVVELADLSTRPRELEESSSGTAGKRRREVGDVELASKVELRSTRRRVANESATELLSGEEINCAFQLPSCSSSNALVEIDEDRSTISDPTVRTETSNMTQGRTESAQLQTLTFSAGIERSATCAVEFGNLESTPSAEADSRPKSTAVAEMPPSESEIEDFFSAAETDLQKRFTERYNFDIVNGVPLEGRYEWVPVKPAMR